MKTDVREHLDHILDNLRQLLSTFNNTPPSSPGRSFYLRTADRFVSEIRPLLLQEGHAGPAHSFPVLTKNAGSEFFIQAIRILEQVLETSPLPIPADGRVWRIWAIDTLKPFLPMLEKQNPEFTGAVANWPDEWLRAGLSLCVMIQEGPKNEVEFLKGQIEKLEREKTEIIRAAEHRHMDIQLHRRALEVMRSHLEVESPQVHDQAVAEVRAILEGLN